MVNIQTTLSRLSTSLIIPFGNNPFKTVDEERAINALEFLVDYYCNNYIEVVGYASSYEEALKYLGIETPDVIFLDFKLGDKTGFDLLQQIVELPNTEIIIVTAYDEYALEAFKFNAISYLLKPVLPEMLQRVVSKINTRATSKSSKVIGNLLKTQQERIFYPSRDGYDSLLHQDIIYINADGSYLIIHTTDQTEIIVSKNLSFFETFLEKQPDFIRIHKSYIINKRHVKKIDKHGGLKLVLTNDAGIPVSPTMNNIVMDFIGS